MILRRLLARNAKGEPVVGLPFVRHRASFDPPSDIDRQPMANGHSVAVRQVRAYFAPSRGQRVGRKD